MGLCLNASKAEARLEKATLMDLICMRGSISVRVDTYNSCSEEPPRNLNTPNLKLHVAYVRV